jgi:hypothetical protein
MQTSESLEQKIDKIYVALLGDEFGSKGIVDRLTDVEKEAELSKNFRQKTMAGLSFIVACGAILAWIGDKIFEILKSK